MTDEIVSTMVVNLPNFAGFTFALILMYRVLMKQIDQNERAQEQLRSCLKDMLRNHNPSYEEMP